jgi:hypothetical protein
MRPRPGRWLAALATGISGFMVAAQQAGGLGRLVVFAFTLGVPALAISGLLPRATIGPVVLVSLAGAAVINAVVAQTMLSLDRWSPQMGVVVVGLVSAGLWLLPAVSPTATDTGGR